MARPYPWKSQENFDNIRRRWDKIHLIGLFIFLLASILFHIILAPLIAIIAIMQFREHNNGRYSRGLIIVSVGVILLALWVIASLPISGLPGIMKNGFTSHTVISYLWQGIPMATLSAGIYVLIASQHQHYAGERFIRPHDMTRLEERKIEKTRQGLASGELATTQNCELGVIVDDVLPWRTSRRGMIAGAPMSAMASHGFIAGGTRMGKTIAAQQIINEALDAGWTVAMLDYKGDGSVPATLARIAQEHGRNFYMGSINLQSRSHMNFDPLVDIDPRDIPSVLKTSFNMADDGDSAYWAGEGLKLVRALMDAKEAGIFAPLAHESTIDWLVRSMTTSDFTDALTKAQGSANHEIVEKASEIRSAFYDPLTKDGQKSVSSILTKLLAMRSSFGERMRPSAHSFSIREAIDEGGLLYFDLPVTGDSEAAIGAGAMVLRNFANLRNERVERQANGEDLPPLLVVADEINNIGDKGDVAKEIVTQGSETNMFLLVSVQSFESMKEGELYSAVVSNVGYTIVMGLQAGKIADEISTLFGKRKELSVTQEASTNVDTLGLETRDAEVSRARGQIDDNAPRIHPDEIAALKKYHAFFYVKHSFTRARRKRDEKNKAWLGKRAPRLLLPRRRDDIGTDVPTVHIVPRDYILEPGSDTLREELQRTYLVLEEKNSHVVDAIKKGKAKRTPLRPDDPIPPITPQPEDSGEPHIEGNMKAQAWTPNQGDDGLWQV